MKLSTGTNDQTHLADSIHPKVIESHLRIDLGYDDLSLSHQRISTPEGRHHLKDNRNILSRRNYIRHSPFVESSLARFHSSSRIPEIPTCFCLGNNLFLGSCSRRVAHVQMLGEAGLSTS